MARRRRVLGALIAGAMLGSASSPRAQIVYGDGDSVANPLVLTADTQLQVAAGAATQSGAVSDGGNIFGIVKTGAGALTLSGANTYGGDTTITAGFLIASRLTGGNISALGSGTIRLSGGALRTDVTGTYAQDVVFTAGASSVFSAASGQLAQIGTSLSIGAGATAIFGVAGVAGTAFVGNASVTIDASATIVVAGGTLGGRTDFGTALRSGSTRVDAGAILDLRDASSPTIRNLSGAGEVRIPGGTVESPGLSLTVDGGASTTFSGVISGLNGSSSVLVTTRPGTTGTGTVILAGANTYAGGTTICNCTVLQLGNGGASGSILNDVANAGTLAFNRSDTYSFAGVISNDALTAGSAGKVVQMGPGTTILTGTNTYSGGTTIAGGTLSVSRDANLGAAAGGLTFNGGVLQITGTSFTTARTITFGNGGGGLDIADAAFSFTLAAALTGPGGFSKAGPGTAVLSGANSHSGATSVTGGTLRAGAAGAFSANSAFTVASGATLSLNGFSQSIGSLAGAGAAAIGAATLTTGSNNNSTTFSGAILGTGGLVKTGSGTLSLTGTSSFTGATSVGAGMLVVNGSLAGSVVTLNGGTLGGSGTVGGINAVAGAVAPGNSIGTLSVAGNVAFGPGSTYQVEANAAGAADRINATGTATLTGGLVQVLAEQGDYALSTRYVILAAQGGVGGTFASLTTNLAFLTPTLTYGADEVVLTLARNDVSFGAGPGRFVAITRNQTGAGRAAEALGAGNRIHDALISSTIAEARAGFDALSGEAHAQGVSVAIETSHLVREAVLNRLLAPFETSASLGAMQGAFSADLPGRKGGVALPAPRIETSRVTLWGEAIGAARRSQGDGNAASLERRGGGMLAGAELESNGVSAWRVGALAGFTRHHFDLDARRSSGTQDVVHAALYGGARLGAVTLRAGATYAWNETDLTRQVLLRGFSDVLRHDGAGATAQGFVEIGYALQAGGIAFEPFAQIALVHVRGEAGTEQGGAAALRASGSSQNLGFTTLGLRAEAQVPGMPLFARGMLGWRHAFGETTPSARLSFASGGGAFNVYAAPVARDALVAEAGLSWRVSGLTSLGVAYTAALGEGQRDHALKGRLDVRF
jgi:outer membrane autotransporter protein